MQSTQEAQEVQTDELGQHLQPGYFDQLIEKALAEKSRAEAALKLLHEGDMAYESLEFIGEHIDTMICKWRASSQRAQKRLEQRYRQLS